MFIRVAATCGSGLAVIPAAVLGAAGQPPKRKFTVALSCGAIGVKAAPREAIELAHRFGFEAVEPAADFLGKLSDGALAELLADMKTKNLVWASAGLPVDFRNTDATFQDSLKRSTLALALQAGMEHDDQLYVGCSNNAGNVGRKGAVRELWNNNNNNELAAPPAKGCHCGRIEC